ncbi:MAG: branched-chain amino acid transport system II carrier protein, partial [Pseudomonadota bacterium]
PLKIVGIALIIFVAVKQSPELIPMSQAGNPFILGITQGYQTMDLMASLFFSITIVEYLRSVCKSKNETIRLSIMSSIIGGGLIALVYVGFIYLGAHYADRLIDINPEQYLAVIAQITLGKHAALIVALTIFLSTLVTAASLVKLFAEFLKTDIAKEKISWVNSVFVTIIIGYGLSLIGFSKIASMLHAVLSYIYQALITLSISAILYKTYGFRWTKQLFWLTILAFAGYGFV